MKSSVYITQYNDISIDGYIAGPNDDTRWIPECGSAQFSKILSENEVILMGKRSYEFAVLENTFPYDCKLNLIMTHDPNLTEKTEIPKIIFTDKSPQDIVKLIADQGYTKVFLMGGGKLNASFLAAGLIEKTILTVHPIALGAGTKLYEDLPQRFQLKERLKIENLSGGSYVIEYQTR
jgi:dihydrofolate reductase